MIRSTILAALLALSLALFSLSYWGKTEINNPEQFAQQSRQVLQSSEVRSLLTTKITEEIWKRTDASKEIQSLLPPEAGFLDGPADFVSRAALASLVDNILQQNFVEDIWQESVQIAHENALRALQDRNSALLIEREVIFLDVQVLLQTAVKKIGLPREISSNIPPGIGQIELARTENIAKAQKAYNLLNISPLLLFISTVLFLALLVVVNRKQIWQGMAWISGALIVAGASLLVAKEVSFPFVANEFENPLSSSIARVVWEDFSRSAYDTSEKFFLVAALLALLALLFSPRLKVQREKFIQETKKRYADFRSNN